MSHPPRITVGLARERYEIAWAEPESAVAHAITKVWDTPVFKTMFSVCGKVVLGTNDADDEEMCCLRCLRKLSAYDTEQSERCGSLYPGGHGETRECVRARGHTGAHRYDTEQSDDYQPEKDNHADRFGG